MIKKIGAFTYCISAIAMVIFKLVTAIDFKNIMNTDKDLLVGSLILFGLIVIGLLMMKSNGLAWILIGIIIFAFSIWNPGTVLKDVFYKVVNYGGLIILAIGVIIGIVDSYKAISK